MRLGKTQKLVLTGIFIAIGLILPMLTGMIPGIGMALLPMHLPIFICAYVCGSKYAGLAGIITPLLKVAIWGVPPLMPIGIAMSLELMVYGVVAGAIFWKMKKTLFAAYVGLIIAMVLGRVTWGIAMFAMLGINGQAFTMDAFLSGVLLTSIPGIVIQLLFVPVLGVTLVNRMKATSKASC